MLILRRKRGQAVVIHGQVKIIVKVLRQENGEVTLGFEAPVNMSVDREEVYLKKEVKL
jgi:carbon storage regulator CsrA